MGVYSFTRLIRAETHIYKKQLPSRSIAHLPSYQLTLDAVAMIALFAHSNSQA